jgi:serine/threonine protein kinase
MDPTDRLVLPDEVIVFPIAALDPSVRAAIGCDPGEYGVTRRRSRHTTRVVDRAAAELIREFREPSSVVEAIRRFTSRAGLPVEDVVEPCVPLLNEMINDGFIVPVGMEEPAADSDQLRVGAFVGRWEVLEPIQLLDDSDVYRVQSAEGVEGALKRVLAGRDPWVLRALRNERRILQRLEGTTSPTVLEDGTDAERPYLVISWCEGTPATSAASQLRRPWSHEARGSVAELCSAILDAYVELHRRGVVHGDVHPRNLLFDANTGQVHVIDFGLALDGSEERLRSGLRGGVQEFYPPEYAAACLADESEPPPTPAGEQYSLAALLYKLLTGEGYLHAVLEDRRWLEAVCTQPPREFSRLAIPPSPNIEAVLSRALAKDPDDRFESIAQFRDGFAKAIDADLQPDPPSSAAPSWAPPGLFPALTARLDLDEGINRVLSRPTATVNYGAAGIAYLFYRASCVLNRPDLLALADVWIERAKLALAESPSEACFDPRIGLDPRTIGRSGLYHSAVGVHCVDTLIACVTGDLRRADAAVERFVAAAETAEGRDDLVTGRAGHLVGCVCALEALRAGGYGEERLLPFGRRRHAELLAKWSSCAVAVAGTDEVYWGVAHGWAGLAYAMLRFNSLAHEPVAPEVVATLDELAGHALTDGGRAWWPHGPADDVVWPGWCNGSAGYVMLWSLAHRMLSGDRFLELARMAAEHSWSQPPMTGQLCCGAAGQAYAFLSLHRLTGEGRYADRARAMLDRAMTFIGSPGMIQDSLYKGDVGVALLEAELSEPFLSAMPLYESEGWPSGP